MSDKPSPYEGLLSCVTELLNSAPLKYLHPDPITAFDFPFESPLVDYQKQVMANDEGIDVEPPRVNNMYLTTTTFGNYSMTEAMYGNEQGYEALPGVPAETHFTPRLMDQLLNDNRYREIRDGQNRLIALAALDLLIFIAVNGPDAATGSIVIGIVLESYNSYNN